MEIEQLAKQVVDQIAESGGRLKVRTVAKQVLAVQLGTSPSPEQVRNLASAVARFLDDRPIPTSVNEHDAGGGRHFIRKHILE